MTEQTTNMYKVRAFLGKWLCQTSHGHLLLEQCFIYRMHGTGLHSKCEAVSIKTYFIKQYKVQIGNDQEMVQSERNPHYIN